MKIVRALTLIILLCLMAASSPAADRAVLKWIQKGPKIKKITIEGNKFFSEHDITGRLYSKISNFWRSSIRDDRQAKLQRETMSRDSLEVMYLYITNGFLGAGFSERFEPMGKDSSAQVIITVHEGRRFFFGEKRFVGDYNPYYNFVLNKTAAALKVGKPMDLIQLRNVAFEMKTVFANEGYPYAQIDYALDTLGADSLAPITFTVKSDSLVHFGSVTIVDSLKYVPEYVATRELKIKPGALYRRDDIVSSQQRLYESGYFSTLVLKMDEASPDRLNPNFILKLTERKPRYLTFQTGAAQSQTRDLTWDFSTGFGKRNFLKSRRIDVASTYSFAIGQGSQLIVHKYDLSYTEPWFLGFRMPLTFTGEIQPKLKSDIQDYDIGKWSISATSLKKFSREVTANLGFEYQAISITNIDSALLPSVKQEAGNTTKRRIYLQFRRDSRNDLFIPDRGSLTSITAQYVGGFLGGDDNFKKVEASWSSYQRVWPGWISATRLSGGWIVPFTGSEFVPTDDRLYLGGANTVRGFSEKSLGPVLPDGSPAGSNFTTVFNQEFRWRTFPLFKVISERFASRFPLWQSVFVDVGNGFSSEKDFHWNRLAITYGTGIQLVSPAGPIRVDYAQVVPTNGFHYQSHWHFTILYAF